MKFLGTLLILGGYILVYAAVANGGKFYANPWMGVFRDAYGVDSAAGGATQPASPAATAPSIRPRTSPATSA